MKSVDQAVLRPRNVWARIASPTLLRYPVLGMSMVLTMTAPCAASARPQGSGVFAFSRLSQRQMRMVYRYERYLSRIAAQSRKARQVVRFAYRQIGKPYQWGGAGPRSYDCSGLAMTAWHRAGLQLPHRADLQYRVIRRKVPFRGLRPGDLVFFSGARHVGIYVGHGRFIHAPHSGTVVQRGSLMGWRRRAFAGAARPGAPAYRRWPHWVRALVHTAATGTEGSTSWPVRAPSVSVGMVPIPTSSESLPGPVPTATAGPSGPPGPTHPDADGPPNPTPTASASAPGPGAAPESHPASPAAPAAQAPSGPRAALPPSEARVALPPSSAARASVPARSHAASRGRAYRPSASVSAYYRPVADPAPAGRPAARPGVGASQDVGAPR